jgi:HEAT repeat protein
MSRRFVAMLLVAGAASPFEEAPIQEPNSPEAQLAVALGQLKGPNVTIRRQGLRSLARLGPRAAAAIPALIETLRDPVREVRREAAETLAAVGPEAVAPLILALDDRDARVRGGASLALEGLGERAAPAGPRLVAALSDPEPPDDPAPPRGTEPQGFVEWEREDEPHPTGFFAALAAFGAGAVPPLRARLEGPDPRARARALVALGFLGEHAKAAVPKMIELLDDSAFRDAAEALGTIGPGAREAVPHLIALLHGPDAAAEALGAIGPEAAPALGALGKRLVGDEDPAVRRAAEAAIKAISDM